MSDTSATTSATTSTGASRTPKSGSRMGRPPKTTAAEIVDAAHKLFGARGIKGTTLAAVGEEVGLTDAGVLHHFTSKQTLVQAVLDRELEQQIGQVRELIEVGGLTAIRRMAVWGSVVEQTPELAGLMVVMTAEGISEDSPFHEYLVRRYANVHDLVVGLIREGVASGEIRADVDADWEASALVAYLDGIRLQWFLSGRQLALADAVERYFDQLIDRLAP